MKQFNEIYSLNKIEEIKTEIKEIGARKFCAMHKLPYSSVMNFLRTGSKPTFLMVSKLGFVLGISL